MSKLIYLTEIQHPVFEQNIESFIVDNVNNRIFFDSPGGSDKSEIIVVNLYFDWNNVVN